MCLSDNRFFQLVCRLYRRDIWLKIDGLCVHNPLVLPATGGKLVIRSIFCQSFFRLICNQESIIELRIVGLYESRILILSNGDFHQLDRGEGPMLRNNITGRRLLILPVVAALALRNNNSRANCQLPIYIVVLSCQANCRLFFPSALKSMFGVMRMLRNSLSRAPIHYSSFCNS